MRARLAGGTRAAFVASALFLALGGCGRDPDSPLLGYAEAEPIRVAAPFAGQLVTLDVERGQNVAADAPLFALEQENERAAREEAEARLMRAQAQLENARKGRRPPELETIRAQITEARAARELSARQLARRRELIAQGFVSAATLDEARSAYDRDVARVRQLEAQLVTAKLPARTDEIAAAEAEVAAARQALAQVQWRLDERRQRAPAAGRIEDRFYRVGEYVAAGAPVISLLPPDHMKVRFYLPEAEVARVKLGQAVEIRCDGCGAPMRGTVSFIATEAEYTPPVIYSKENRAKLVFLAEARVSPEDATRLRAGLPVEIRPAVKGSTGS